MADPFAVMRNTLLASVLAEPVTVGGVIMRGVVERDQKIIGEYGEIAGLRTVLHLPSSAAVTLGAAVLMGGKAWCIDAKLSCDSQFSAWVLREAA